MASTISCSFIQNSEDWFEYQSYATRRISLRNSSYRVYLFVFFPAVMLFIDSYFIEISVVSVISIIAGILFFYWYITNTIFGKQKKAKQMNKAYKIEDVEEVLFEIYDDEIVWKTKNKESKLKYLWIKEIVNIEKYVFLIGNKGSAYVIPKQKIEKNKIDEIIRTITQKIEQQK